jgi:hypothetical protein
MRIVLDGVFGPNECDISHDPVASRVFVESKQRLTIGDFLEIESQLGLDMHLGKRWHVTESQTQDGWITIWDYLEFKDCDWD